MTAATITHPAANYRIRSRRVRVTVPGDGLHRLDVTITTAGDRSAVRVLGVATPITPRRPSRRGGRTVAIDLYLTPGDRRGLLGGWILTTSPQLSPRRQRHWMRAIAARLRLFGYRGPEEPDAS